MKSRNICKFPPGIPGGSTLIARRFVKETDPTVMERKQTLSEHRMLLPAEGEGKILIDGTTYPLERGTLFFCFAGESVAVEACEGLAYLYIDFSGDRATELFGRFDLTPLTRTAAGQESLIPLWQESLFRASGSNCDLVAEGLLLFSFSRLTCERAAECGLVARIIDMTEEGFRDPTLGIAEIARELSYHPKYLSHLFKRKTGVTYSEYLRSVRLKYATALFDHGLDSVKNVALLSGFADPLYFSGVFKRQMGLSPKDYLRAQKEKPQDT